MSIADAVVAAPGTNISVPIALSDLTGLGVLSADVVITFDPAVLQATAVTPGSLVPGPGCLVTPNLLVSGQATISAFCTTHMTGSGTLALLDFLVVGGGGTSTPLTIATAQLNEGTPGVCRDSGSLGACTASNGDNGCDGVDDDCSGTPDDDYVPAPTACGAGSCTATGSLVCTAGVLHDTCLPPIPLSMADGVVAAPGTNLSVPLTLGDVTGRDVLSADVVVTFNPAVLQAVSVTPGTLTSGPGCLVTPNLLVSGQVTVSAFCPEHMTGSGTLVAIDFLVVAGSGGGTTPLTIAAAQLNEGTPGVCADGGSLSSCTANDGDNDCDGVDDDCSGAADDDYAPTPTSCGPPSCPSTGATSCVGGIEQDSCVAPSAAISVPAIVTATPGQTLVVPIDVSDLTGLGVVSGDITLVYDAAVLHPIAVGTGTVSAACTGTGNLVISGSVQFGFYCISVLSGAGSIAEVTFEVVGEYGSMSPLSLTSVLLNEGDPTACAVGGGFSVCGPGIALGTPCVLMPGSCAPPGHLVCSADGASAVCVNDALLEVEHDTPTSARIKWQPIPGAGVYDVVRGDLGTLRGSDGDYSAATQMCLTDNNLQTFEYDVEVPGVSQGFWYLMRADLCTGGSTYEEGSLSQVGLRDPGIALSGLACP